VFIIDDDASVRESIQDLLESLGLRSESFGTAEEFLAKQTAGGAKLPGPGRETSGVNGLDFQSRWSTPVSNPDHFHHRPWRHSMTVKAMKSGCSRVPHQTFLERDLLGAIRQALERDRATRQQQAKPCRVRGRYEALTAREREVMHLVVSGMLNKQSPLSSGPAKSP